MSTFEPNIVLADPSHTTFDPVRLVAVVEVLLHQQGVATVAGGGMSAVTAAGDLLRALGVAPVDQHRPVQYRVEVMQVLATAATLDGAEDFAHALRTTPLGRRGLVVVEAVAAPAVA